MEALLGGRRGYTVNGLMCYGTPRQMACWTQQTHFGMSDVEGGGQDQARKEPAQEVVKWLKAQVTKPDPLASGPKTRSSGLYSQLRASLKDKLEMPTIGNSPFIQLAKEMALELMSLAAEFVEGL